MRERVFFIFIIVFFVGAALYSLLFSHPPTDDALDARVGEATVIQGLVILEPLHREHNQRFVIAVDGARVSITSERYPTLRYGDSVELSGQLELPESFVTENGRLFDYSRYLAKDGIGYVMLYPDVAIMERDGGFWLKRKLFALRRVFLAVLSRAVPQPNAALLGGITVGAQDGLSEELEDVFREVGLVHILVLSGYNITIVAETVMRALRFARRRAVEWCGGALVIILFVIMTGATSATVRAGLMAILVVIARMIGRRYDMARALLIAGAIMVLQNPDIILFDPSFQLSFLATLGLIYGTPLVEKFFVWLPKRFQLRESAMATSATQLFVLPLLMYQTGTVSFITLIANMLVLPLMPTLMLLTFLVGVAGSVAHVFAQPFAWGAFALSTYVIQTAELLARIPYVTLRLGAMPLAVVVGLYAVLALIIWRRRRAASRLCSS